VTNHAGHKLPTGYPEGRQMWLNVRAYGPAGGLLYESGAYDAITGQLQRDPDARVYEAKQGLTPELATLLGRAPGATFHFVLNNTVVKDNRIPPRGYEQAAFDRPGLRPIGATYADGQHWDGATYTLPLQTRWIEVRLYYQTASREYVEFLAANGGADGQTLSSLWASRKSPPQLMAVTLVPARHQYLPVIRR
jgi:hypothetical protein